MYVPTRRERGTVHVALRYIATCSSLHLPVQGAGAPSFIRILEWSRFYSRQIPHRLVATPPRPGRCGATPARARAAAPSLNAPERKKNMHRHCYVDLHYMLYIHVCTCTLRVFLAENEPAHASHVMHLIASVVFAAKASKGLRTYWISCCRRIEQPPQNE